MATRPSFLLIYTDQQQAYQLGCMGHPDLKTPNLDELARSGVLFRRNYTPNTVCMPARNSLVTGLNPRGHRVLQNGCRARSDVPTIPGILAAAGYRTHAIGKIHLEPANLPPTYQADDVCPEDFPEASEMWSSGRIETLPLPYYGFQTVDFANGHGDGVYGEYLSWLRRTDPQAVRLLARANPRKPPTGALSSWKSSLPAELHVNRWVADRTIGFLKQTVNSHQPFLCWANFPDPHAPWCPSNPYDELYDPAEVKLPVDAEAAFPERPASVESYVRNFLFGSVRPEQRSGAALREITAHAYGMISHIDVEVGRILSALDELRLRENTVVVFMSDHGEMLGRRGLLMKGPFNVEEIIRVPLIVSCPGRFARGKAVQSVTSSLDVSATIMDLSGCVYPENEWALSAAFCGLPEALPGRSLVPVLNGLQERIRARALVEYDEDYTGCSIRCRLRTLVTERYKLNYYAGEDYGEIYDLECDHQELDNLWDNPKARDIRSQLMAELADEVISSESWFPRRVTPC